MECLHFGFDGLDVAFRGALPLGALEKLALARDEAQAEMRPVLVEIGGVRGLVAETGARGGFRYRLDTGDDGEIWFFKHSEARDEWNIRVSCRARPLALHGYSVVRDGLRARLEAMGVDVRGESVGRVDLAADFVLPGFELRAERFVAHSRTTKEERGEAEKREYLVCMKGRRTTSVTIGKMPGRQVIVYDKRAEVIQRQKLFWFDLWGRRPDCPVWRVELRLGKKALKERWGVTTFADLDATIADMIEDAFAGVRYLADGKLVGNVTRAPVHEFWVQAHDKIRALGAGKAGVVPGKIIAGRRAEIRVMYQSLVTGLAASLAAVDGVRAEDLPARIEGLLRAYIRGNPGIFDRKLAKAKERMVIYGDEMQSRAGAVAA